MALLASCGSGGSGEGLPGEDPVFHWIVGVLNNESKCPQVNIFEDCGGTADQVDYMAAFSGYATDTSINCYADGGTYRYIDRID